VRMLEANRAGEDSPAEFDGFHGLSVHR
jgi:hypothetical protein